MVSLINNAFMRLQLRSENVDSTKLLATFVDVGPLFTLLSTPDHQVLYGRRGTGKTHALRYLAETRQQKGDLAVYVDMRKLGSSGGIYADSGIPVAERATRLLVDTLTTIHDYLYEYFVTWDEQYDLSRTGPILDGFAEAITEVAVSGQVEKETISSDTSSSSNSADTRLEMNGQGFNVSLGSSSAKSHQDQLQSRVTETGVVRHRVHFGSVSKAFEDITDIISPKRVWLLLDEWSSVPIDLQPYLADLLRRAVFPLRGITVKIGAIEFRSLFKYKGERGDYIGIELGADASANLDLDDFMAFDNDAEKAKQFFQELLFRHFKEIEELDLSSVPKSSTELIQQGEVTP